MPGTGVASGGESCASFEGATDSRVAVLGRDEPGSGPAGVGDPGPSGDGPVIEDFSVVFCREDCSDGGGSDWMTERSSLLVLTAAAWIIGT